MGHWEFNTANPSDVRVEVTQRDQFNNDEVGLGEALVREVIQNSSDAGLPSGPVKVRFALREAKGAEAKYLAELLRPLQPNMLATKTDFTCIDEPVCRVLVVEDFNTRELTGKFDAIDGDNFTISGVLSASPKRKANPVAAGALESWSTPPPHVRRCSLA